MSDTQLFLLINGLAGKNKFFDVLFQGLATDYFLTVGFCLVLVFIWFATASDLPFGGNRKAVLAAVLSMGIANGLVQLSNALFVRVRPFDALPANEVHLLFYKPSDSSFPSNFAAVLFAIALAVCVKNRKFGVPLLILALIGGFARVYVGVHYPLDILGGVGCALLATFFSYLVLRIMDPLLQFLLNFLRKYYLV